MRGIQKVSFRGADKLKMEDNLAANGAEANPPSRFSIVLCRQDDDDNITRFLILAIEPIIAGNDRPYKTSIVFTLEEGPGMLFKALAVFALRNINLTKIESHPQRKRPLRVVDDSNKGSANSLGEIHSSRECPKLKQLDLSRCENLISIPDLSYIPSAKIIGLESCSSLHEIHSSRECPKLKQLDLSRCENLISIPDLSYIPSAKIIGLESCSSLHEIHSSRECPKLKQLDLSINQDTEDTSGCNDTEETCEPDPKRICTEANQCS
ncbi:hypothetical protein LWI28_028606 [Acer negundo]|uniref:ACT domain-containing protein n=1 Tax=Acer negundo TaxID=4023 RepID=A0AAD5JGC7_ACENE|nr:hypothetical protein LWI28_028606 [Acer negundo]